MSAPSHEQIADAIEILSMCKPISETQGGMWFGRNLNFADATFVDYGACRAFAVAARALPVLVERQAALVKALTLAEDILSRRPFSTEIWPNGMHPQEGIEQIRAALATIEVQP